MAEKLSGQKIRAALVFQAVQLGQHLRTALAEAGIDVVAESTAKSLAASGFDATLDVFVVNLDPELEDHLDEVSDLLDRYERPVIFNDGAASSGLAGWDQARWARHLASKIRGELDSHPPRPIDATYIPDQPKPKAKPAPSPPVAAVLAPSKPLSATIELPKFELPVQLPASADFGAAPDALRADFDLPELPNSAAETFDLKDADFGWDELDALAPDPIPSVASPVEADFFDLPDFELALEPEVDAPDEFETLLRSQKNESIPAPIVPMVAAKAAVVSAADTSAADSLKSAPMEWSLEPLDSEDFAVPIAPTSGRASFVVKDVAVKEAALPIGAKPEAKPVVQTLDVLDELADLDFFADLPQSPEASPSSAPIVQNQSQDPTAPQSSQSLEQLFADLDDISFDASEPLTSSAASSGVSESTSFVDDFDFDMDVEAPAPMQSSAVQSSSKDSSSDIADFDSLFSNSGSPEAHAGFASSTGPGKVYVLGASIGGPEAVKTFLSKLKPGISAAFVLAQHMGAEFLELMAGQLSKSSALPVKLAQEGVLLRESEVVVVPVNKRFMIDAAGNVEFQENFDESPYSPSIDQVMSDMSDRFGNRCVGIIFSGMASDAIEGSKVIASRGGKVWVQDPATCVISSMIDGAQAAGVVSYVGAPEQLADHVLEDLGMR